MCCDFFNNHNVEIKKLQPFKNTKNDIFGRKGNFGKFYFVREGFHFEKIERMGGIRGLFLLLFEIQYRGNMKN